MKHTLALLLLLLSFTTFAQQVQNVVATQQGSSVVVNYDLAGSPNSSYFVKLLMSKNGGQSFSQPLKYVTGDVGNAKIGINKKIIWNAEKELTFFNGSAIFRVEATSLSAPMPPPVEDVPGMIEIIKLTRKGNKVYVDFMLTPSKDIKITISNNKNSTFIIDNLGSKASTSSGSFGNSNIGYYSVSVIGKIPTRGKLVFENIIANSSKMPLLAITIKYNYEEYLYKFLNTPITK